MEKSKVVQRKVSNESEIIEIGKFQELMNKEAMNSRICSKHKISVEYKYERINNPFGVPFEIILESCCKEAIEEEVEFIKVKLKENQQK